MGKIVGINGLLLSEIETFFLSHANSDDEHGFHIGDVSFTTDLNRDLDLLVIFNTPSQNLVLNRACPIVAFMMEPGHKIYHPWIFKGRNQYNQVYTPVVDTDEQNLIKSHGYLGWHLNMPFKEIQTLQAEDLCKDRSLSVAISDVTVYPGHVQRLQWLSSVLQNIPECPIYGRGFNAVEDKRDMHWRYEYGLVMENTVQQDYITEKLLDAFLSYTVPIYRGATNVTSYFPEESIIDVSGDTPKVAAKKINKVLKNDNDYAQRLPYLKKARNIVLEQFNPLRKAAELAGSSFDFNSKENGNIKTIKPNPLAKKIYWMVMYNYYRFKTKKEREKISCKVTASSG